ncbi:VOC family protein [Lichenifustis flavocetrariae]|uniref:VOC family protein n=1 Tax=Lichenifustis flavocetrariae TaxID=2949735 RepID=A0AA41YSN1_9HYPH|nr:VOC family protein [Lichenifustis flavocetrariae]MCW6506585.1 VOC family protein [Lichenifustis flavocetrariae]
MAVTAPGGPTAAIESVCLTVPDLDRAADFYRDALHFWPVGPRLPCNPDRIALLGVAPECTMRSQTMRLGAQTIELFAFDPPGQPYPTDSTASDLWFQHCAIVVDDIVEAVAGLNETEIRPITQGAPQTLPPNTGSVTAFKFRDPFGHPLELLAFPPGVGDALWHAPGADLFQGIDHTAIVVSDVDSSARFYEALFGFEPGGRSTNRGPEQSRLDGIADVEVDVLALTPRGAPPHLELLGYRAGRRRARPSDWTSRDQAITRILIAVDDVAAVTARLDPSWPRHRGTWDGAEALALQDPDGHALIVRAAL